MSAAGHRDGMSAVLTLTLDPSGEVLAGDHIDIRISGAAPGAEVTVIGVSRFWDDKKMLRSEAVFRADAAGCVDLSRDAPVRGSYAGVHPAGLFWSMTGAGACDADTPPHRVVRIEVVAGSARATAVLKLPGTGRDVVKRPAPFPGAFLAALPGVKRRPTIIGLSGSDGGDGAGHYHAAKLASRGYAVLGFPYYSPLTLETPIAGLPTAFQEIPVDRLQAAYEWLCEQSEVDPDHVGIWGGSKGAEFALIAATKFSWIKSVVAVAPTDVVWEGWDEGATVHVETSSFSWQGAPLPYTPTVDTGSIFENLVRGRAAHPREAELARIPIESYRQPLMLIAGEDDEIWPAADMARAIAKHRAEAELLTEMLIYPEAGHQLADDGYSSAEWSCKTGGTLQAQGVARRDAFVKALRFLEETLGAVER